jgi:hypothetical protein
MTLYRLYQQNGHRAGFWVQHRTWSNTCGRVVSIAGRDCGPLPGGPPEHDGAPVVMHLFDIRSGRMLDRADQRRALPPWEDDTDAAVASEIGHSLDPSDRQYTGIAEPFWHAHGREHA